jgi:8-oxo-dGTP diphosphatase
LKQCKRANKKPMYCEPKVGVGVFVCRGGEILLGKRKNAHGEGEWSLPGGHLEPGESFRDCCIREVKEETGIDISDRMIEFEDLTNDLFPKEGLHYVTLFFYVEVIGAEAKLMEPEKCEEWKWFYKNKLPKPLFAPLKHFLEE